MPRSSLTRSNLVAEQVLRLHLRILGSGRRLFTGDGRFAARGFRDSKTTDNGVVIATYQPGERSRSGMTSRARPGAHEGRKFVILGE